jgi:hypothetical protein
MRHSVQQGFLGKEQLDMVDVDTDAALLLERLYARAAKTSSADGSADYSRI